MFVDDSLTWFGGHLPRANGRLLRDVTVTIPLRRVPLNPMGRDALSPNGALAHGVRDIGIRPQMRRPDHSDQVARRLRSRDRMRPEVPFVLGTDVAGVVRRTPPGAGLSVGDRVAAFTWVGGAAELVAVRQAGADHVLAADEFRRQLTGITGGKGIDVVVDPVGGDRFTDSLRTLDPDGRLLVIGFTGGAIPTVKVNRLLLNNISVVGVAWGLWRTWRRDARWERWCST